MTGRCHHCRCKTMALPGSQAREARQFPPFGFRLGWVVEKSGSAYLVCWDCVHKTLVAAA